MFTDIFSSFDPYVSMYSLPLPPQLFWMLSLATLMPLMPPLWVPPSRLSWLLLAPISMVHQQLSQSRSRRLLGWNPTVYTLFPLLIFLNTIGLAPYVFGLTSHLLLTLSFGLVLWLSLIMSATTAAPAELLAHLLPSGAPTWLNPFLVLIESTSVSVRPVTLSFRLAANMSAGHIVITLIAVFSAAALFSSLFMSSLLLPTQMGYLLFELAICFIQAFIFTLLLSIYSDDHP